MWRRTIFFNLNTLQNWDGMSGKEASADVCESMRKKNPFFFRILSQTSDKTFLGKIRLHIRLTG
jgi:hypothetical protein